MASGSKKTLYDINEAEKHFEQFIKDFDRKYKDEEDKKLHYEMFVKNLVKINELNANPNSTATFGINKFADYTEEEMQQMYGRVRKQ
ncbi:uncharacterized protein LOC126369009 [Pectinophora gossypiella]|uniref:uncharacterized protein LOC126369009 n=1 Tax=Pectinophora gossypiella TaxID=13191 RepID=UPI00214E5E13|nr:uncharacterized protein LOC126369009 [Pectinophora gossypiella]